MTRCGIGNCGGGSEKVRRRFQKGFQNEVHREGFRGSHTTSEGGGLRAGSENVSEVVSEASGSGD